jgi:hypothetical protein
MRYCVISKQDDLCGNRFTAWKASVKQPAKSRAVKRREPGPERIVGQVGRGIVITHRQQVQPEETLKIVIVSVRNILFGATFDEPP